MSARPKPGGSGGGTRDPGGRGGTDSLKTTRGVGGGATTMSTTIRGDSSWVVWGDGAVRKWARRARC